MIIAQTPWAYPTSISQITESDAHIAWDSAGLSYIKHDNATYLRTVKTLQHIPNSFAGDRTMKTWYVLASGFNFQNVPEKITGIIVELKTDRGGRITDDTIQFRTVSTWTGYNGAVGDNKANADLGQKKFYGGTMDLWGLDRIGYTGSLGETILRQVILTPNFGIALRFQSHPFWPHNSTPMVDYVKIRLLWSDGNAETDGDGDPLVDGKGNKPAGTGEDEGGDKGSVGSSRGALDNNDAITTLGRPGGNNTGPDIAGTGTNTGTNVVNTSTNSGGTGTNTGTNIGYLGTFDSYIPPPPS